VTLTLADAGCGSGGGVGAAAPSGTYCDVTIAGIEFCTGVSGGGDTSSFASQCPQMGGKIVTSCPTANALGCCSIASNGMTSTSCTYCPSGNPSVNTQSDAKTACTMSGGDFTAGAMKSCGDASTGSSSGTGGDAGGEGGDGGGHAMPGACMQTCSSNAPQNEMGCDPCIQVNCPTEYAACQNDNESGSCINCAQLLQGGDSGVECANTPTIVANLLNCACQSTTCN
jgi:hypothetical protein